LKRKAKFFKKLKRKVFFFFDLNKIKNQFFRIKVRTVDTNVFLTLTNYKHEAIIYRSTGQVSENRKKKTKLSPFTISRLAIAIIKKIRSLKIQYLILNINTRMNKNIRNIFRSIRNSVRVKIVEANYSRPIPHHFGTRKARPKRL
jgi:ribosomal protein S11